MKRSEAIRIVDFPFPQSDFRITVKLPEGDKPFRAPAIPNPMEISLGRRHPGRDGGRRESRLDPRPILQASGQCALSHHSGRLENCNPRHSGRRSMTGVVSAHPHALHSRTMR